MAGHAGCDSLKYPGDDVMKFLWNNTNLEWTGFYLAPAPSQPYTGWMNSRTFLKQLGWGFAPIYVGQQSSGRGSHVVTSAQGTIDAADAASLARQAGFPFRSVIYLDIEQPPTFDQTIINKNIDYFKSWVQEIFNQGYYPGVYCFPSMATTLMHADARPAVWVVHITRSKAYNLMTESFPNPDPISSGFTGANVWQRQQACSLNWNDDFGRRKSFHPIDINSCDTADPANFLNFVGI